MNKKRVYPICTLLLLSAWIMANDTIRARYTFPYIDFFATTYSHPAAALLRPVRDRVTVEAAWGYNNATDYHLLREGKSGNSFGLSAGGIQRDIRKAFWGSVSYRNIGKKSVHWTDVTDLHRIGPYEIADSIGGDVFGEEYVLSGGFTSMAGRYNWAIEAGYRAGNNYRKRDPRPLSTVSEPYLKAGFGMPAGNYRLGAAVSAALYQQDLSISMVESKRNDAFFAMKGFGMYDLLQSTYDSNFSWEYKGNSFGVSMFMLPEKENGWILSAGAVTEKTESQSANKGSTMYPFLFRANTLNLQAGYTRRNAYGSGAIRIDGYLQQGKGKERIYEYVAAETDEETTQTFYEYRLLSESGRYRRDTGHIKATFLREWYRSRNSLWLETGVGIASRSDRYITPDYKIEYLHLTLSAKSGIEIVTNNASWITELKLGYCPLLSSKQVTPENDELFQASMAPDLEILFSSPVSGECSIRYEYLKSKIKWFVSGNFSVMGIKGGNKVNMRFAAGINL